MAGLSTETVRVEAGHRLALVEGVLSSLGKGELALRAARDLVGDAEASERDCRAMLLVERMSLREEGAVAPEAPAPAAAPTTPHTPPSHKPSRSLPKEPEAKKAPQAPAAAKSKEDAPSGDAAEPVAGLPDPAARPEGEPAAQAAPRPAWIKRGERTPRVKAMQRRLNELVTDDDDPLLDDGDFGDKTHERVKRFQKMHGLPQTGSVDGRTLETMRTPPALPLAQTGRQIAREMRGVGAELGFTDRGPAVGGLHEKLAKLGHELEDAAPTGEPQFGRPTQAAVRRIQRENGMVPTGNVDVQTAALIERLTLATSRPAPKQTAAKARPRVRPSRRGGKREGAKVQEATVVGNAMVGGSVTGTRTVAGGPNGAYALPDQVASLLAQKVASVLGLTEPATPDIIGKLERGDEMQEGVLVEGFRKAYLERLHRRGRTGRWIDMPDMPSGARNEGVSATLGLGRPGESDGRTQERLYRDAMAGREGDGGKTREEWAVTQELDTGRHDPQERLGAKKLPAKLKPTAPGGYLDGARELGREWKSGDVATTPDRPGKGTVVSVGPKEVTLDFEGERVSLPHHRLRYAGHAKLREVAERLLETDSRSLPDLPNKPGKSNWVEKAGGLPSYIERIAKHLHHEKGKSVGHSIAIAVNVVKKMCAAGDTNFPGKQNVNAGSRAQACAAVASWEAKKASTHEGAEPEFARSLALAEAALRDGSARTAKARVPSWNFVERTLGEILEADGGEVDWAATDGLEIEEFFGRARRALRKAGGVGKFDEKKHRRDRTGEWTETPHAPEPAHTGKAPAHAARTVREPGKDQVAERQKSGISDRQREREESTRHGLRVDREAEERRGRRERPGEVGPDVDSTPAARRERESGLSDREKREREREAVIVGHRERMERERDHMDADGNFEPGWTLDEKGRWIPESEEEPGFKENRDKARAERRQSGSPENLRRIEREGGFANKGMTVDEKGNVVPDSEEDPRFKRRRDEAEERRADRRRGGRKKKLSEVAEELLFGGDPLEEASAAAWLSRLHPRNRRGRFRDVLGQISSGARNEGGFEGVGDFGGDAFERHAAHQAAKGRSSRTVPRIDVNSRVLYKGQQVTVTRRLDVDERSFVEVELPGGHRVPVNLSELERIPSSGERNAAAGRGVEGGRGRVRHEAYKLPHGPGPLHDWEEKHAGDPQTAAMKAAQDKIDAEERNVGEMKAKLEAEGVQADPETVEFVERMEGVAGRIRKAHDQPTFWGGDEGGAANAGVPGAGDDLAVDMAIGGVLATYPGLTDWSLDKKGDGWELTVEMGSKKHKITVSADGTVAEVGAKKPAGAAVKAKPPVVATVTPPSGTATLSAPAATETYYLTGDTEKVFHMQNGQVYKGADGTYYKKLQNTKMASKKGPIAASEIENLSNGHKKVAPAFVLQTYYELAEPGDGSPPDPLPTAATATATATPGSSEDALFADLSKSVAAGKSVGAGKGGGLKQLAAKVPAGGWGAVEAGDSAGIYNALQDMDGYALEDFRLLPTSVLKRVYETAEDVNYHSVAGKAYQAWQEKLAATSAPSSTPVPKAIADAAPTSFEGLHVVITGKLEGMSRDEAFAKIVAQGGTPQKTVTNDTDFLLTGANVGAAKPAAAAKKGVKVLPFTAVAHLLEGAWDVNVGRAVSTRFALEEATGSDRTRLLARLRVLEARIAPAPAVNGVGSGRATVRRRTRA